MTRYGVPRLGALVRVLVLSMGVYAVDRLTKLLASSLLPNGQSVPVAPGVFHLTLVLNNGAAFGLLQDRRQLFVSVSILCVAAILFYLWIRRSAGPLITVALGFILGGTLGNLFDRVKYGYVIDFLDFRVWPVFNLADSAISVGVALLAFSLFVGKQRCAPGE